MKLHFVLDLLFHTIDIAQDIFIFSSIFLLNIYKWYSNSVALCNNFATMCFNRLIIYKHVHYRQRNDEDTADTLNNYSSKSFIKII
jgi:hypothetical protein